MRSFLAGSILFIVALSQAGAVTEEDVLGPKVKTIPNIIEYLDQSGEFKTLLAALKAADLTETLKSDGEGFTLLAPTDDAFRRLPVGSLDLLMEPSGKQKLAALLGLHIIVGRVSSGQLFVSTKVKTFQGQEIPIRIMAGNYMFDDSKLIQADITCSNGVVQVIDRVLTPLP